jgi:hypothetical protein
VLGFSTISPPQLFSRLFLLIHVHAVLLRPFSEQGFFFVSPLQLFYEQALQPSFFLQQAPQPSFFPQLIAFLLLLTSSSIQLVVLLLHGFYVGALLRPYVFLQLYVFLLQVLRILSF